ncbi:MAG: glycosyltransferase family 39 protein [Candidatus Hydrothermarchaeales archaeon]
MHPSRAGFITAEIIFSVGLSAILLHGIRGRRDSVDSRIHFEPAPKLMIQRILLIGFYIALAAAVAAFLLISIDRPHGGWDAWAIWNMRARFIFRGGDQWTNAFSVFLGWSHPDYPLLVSVLVARGWKYVGHESIMIPALLSMLFTFATVGLVCSSLCILRSKSQGLLAGLVLLGTPFLIENGASQQADVPLGFFFLATLVLFCLHERLSKARGLLFLAGMTAGFSVWTKNEGFLFLLSVIIVHFAFIVPTKGFKAYLGMLTPFAAGLLPILMTVIYFKTQIAPPNDFLSFAGLRGSVERLGDISRYGQVFKAFVGGFTQFGHWVVNAPLVLGLYLFLLGTRFEENEKLGIAMSVASLGVVLTGYFLVYIISPYDLHWHLSTSLSRLLLQTWPSLIFVFFLLVSTPEQAMFSKEERRPWFDRFFRNKDVGDR